MDREQTKLRAREAWNTTLVYFGVRPGDPEPPVSAEELARQRRLNRVLAVVALVLIAASLVAREAGVVGARWAFYVALVVFASAVGGLWSARRAGSR